MARREWIARREIPLFGNPSKDFRLTKSAAAWGTFIVKALRRLQSAPAQTIICFGSFVCLVPVLMPALLAKTGSSLRQLVKARPEILEIVCSPFLASSWSARTRIARITDHCATVATIGGVVKFHPNSAPVELVRFQNLFRYSITLDQPPWLLFDGPLVFSLWEGIDRIFHLCFCLSMENGRRIAYIGGLQGRVQRENEPDVLERYRAFTSAACGLRPRNFLVEAFRMFCRAQQISEIRAVSNLNHPARKLRPDLGISYDEVWLERGGVDRGNGFFLLPVETKRREYEQIPAKKRSTYRRRYLFLDGIESEIKATLK